jgi:hypothetical protein
MSDLSTQKAAFLMQERRTWIGPSVVCQIPLEQIPDDAIDSAVYDGRIRLRAARSISLGDNRVPAVIVHPSDKRTIARELLLNGHYDRAYKALEECWRDSPRSIAAHLGVPLPEALQCFAARRERKIYVQKNRKRDSLRILREVQRYMYSIDEGAIEFNPDELMRIIL